MRPSCEVLEESLALIYSLTSAAHIRRRGLPSTLVKSTRKSVVVKNTRKSVGFPHGDAISTRFSALNTRRPS